jgi:hypothetical protein
MGFKERVQWLREQKQGAQLAKAGVRHGVFMRQMQLGQYEEGGRVLTFEEAMKKLEEHKAGCGGCTLTREMLKQ